VDKQLGKSKGKDGKSCRYFSILSAIPEARKLSFYRTSSLVNCSSYFSGFFDVARADTLVEIADESWTIF